MRGPPAAARCPGRPRDSPAADGEAVPAEAGNLSRGPDGHAVLFYTGDDELTGKVSGHLLGALRQGGAAIVVATPAHRRMIAGRLALAGFDVPAAEAAGAYVALDALETMTRFMVAGWPSAASFWLTISPLIRRAAGSGGPVCVFGEMVALLWDSGQVNAAIEVEAMWNELAVQYPFSLLCSYPVGSVGGEEHQDALAEVCRIHAAVAGDPPGEFPGA
jgi:MEDS: MEthanogen/methylotroph, DcmR Sensory domain